MVVVCATKSLFPPYFPSIFLASAAEAHADKDSGDQSKKNEVSSGASDRSVVSGSVGTLSKSPQKAETSKGDAFIDR